METVVTHNRFQSYVQVLQIKSLLQLHLSQLTKQLSLGHHPHLMDHQLQVTSSSLDFQDHTFISRNQLNAKLPLSQ